MAQLGEDDADDEGCVAEAGFPSMAGRRRRSRRSTEAASEVVVVASSDGSGNRNQIFEYQESAISTY